MTVSQMEELMVCAVHNGALEVLNPLCANGVDLVARMLYEGRDVYTNFTLSVQSGGEPITHEVQILSVEAHPHTYEDIIVFQLGSEQYLMMYVPGDDRSDPLATLIETPWL